MYLQRKTSTKHLFTGVSATKPLIRQWEPHFSVNVIQGRGVSDVWDLQPPGGSSSRTSTKTHREDGEIRQKALPLCRPWEGPIAMARTFP